MTASNKPQDNSMDFFSQDKLTLRMVGILKEHVPMVKELANSLVEFCSNWVPPTTMASYQTKLSLVKFVILLLLLLQ